jgi:hypothetical protein
MEIREAIYMYSTSTMMQTLTDPTHSEFLKSGVHNDNDKEEREEHEAPTPIISDFFSVVAFLILDVGDACQRMHIREVTKEW